MSFALAAIRWLYGVIADDPANAVWLALFVVGVGLIVATHLPERLRPRRSPDKSLDAFKEPGEALLAEARIPQTTATAAQIDEFMARVTEWVDAVTAALIAADDRERIDKWTRVAWHRGRPQPRDRYEAQQYLAWPISERLTMLEEFCQDHSAV